MALWMQAGSLPQTEQEKADLEAIEAIRESTAVELKENGNKFLKMGRRHYADALECYTRAINQKTSDVLNNSILYANRSHVNLLLGNYGRALSDAEDALQLNPINVKAHYRGGKAALALGLWPVASKMVSEGLKQDPANQELHRLKYEVECKIRAQSEEEKLALEARDRVESLLAALVSRNLRIGKSLFNHYSGNRKPWLDSSGVVHWPVLLLYPEVMSSDIIEDFAETDMFRTHFDEMFDESASPLPWDAKKEYQRNRIELYYQANVGLVLSRKQLLRVLMEGEVGSQRLSQDDDANMSDDEIINKQESQWIKVHEKLALFQALARVNHIVPGIPTFFIVASATSFRDKFVSGQWSPG